MLRTPLCDLLGIEVPVMQAAIAPYTSAELVAAVANAGGLGSVGTAMRPVSAVREELARTRELTAGPFAVNFTLHTLEPETWDVALAARPPVVSFALGDPGDLVARAHDAGATVLQQVHTVAQAEHAAARGVDAIIAQGSEAGGFGGQVAALILVPQVVDAVAPVPVLAAGGIADGRGLAAALVLGAQGANIGTRFLAAAETPIPAAWKQAILAAASEDAVRAEFVPDLFPPGPRAPGTGDRFAVAPRALRTPFVEAWNADCPGARQAAARLREEVVAALRTGRMHEYVPFTGQTAGAIHDVRPAAVLVHALVAEARAALSRAGALATPP
jgi:nitronate monooxygenase/enoyl-[acyl-carrier protein] reductase II